MSKSKERAIIKDKIGTFDKSAMIQKALEECKELAYELASLDALITSGSSKVYQKAVYSVVLDQLAEEFADVEITVKDTLFRIWPRMHKAYQKKRNQVYTKQLPKAIAEAQNKDENE